MRKGARSGLAVAGLVTLVALIAVLFWWPPGPGESGRAAVDSGWMAYDCARLGTPEAEVLAAITMPSSPHGISGLERLPLNLVAEDGTAHFANAEVIPERRPDGAVAYRRKVDGQVVGWARWWDTLRHHLVVVFGPDGTVIGRSLYEGRVERTRPRE